MLPQITDSQFNTVGLILVACITIVPTTLAAYWSHRANSNSKDAKTSAAGALHEVKANGGMTDPEPTLKDYVMFVGETASSNSRRLNEMEEMFSSHLQHSQLMDSALARVFFAIRPDIKLPEEADYLNGEESDDEGQSAS